jgi:hypothetical protein
MFNKNNRMKFPVFVGCSTFTKEHSIKFYPKTFKGVTLYSSDGYSSERSGNLPQDKPIQAASWKWFLTEFSL